MQAPVTIIDGEGRTLLPGSAQIHGHAIHQPDKRGGRYFDVVFKKAERALAEAEPVKAAGALEIGRNRISPSGSLSKV